jgi:pyruvate carboxylase subunit B
VNGQRVSVDVGIDGVLVEGRAVRAHLEEVAGTPFCLVSIDGTLHRIAVQREGRGRFNLWSDGYRFSVEALDERRRAIEDMVGTGGANTGPAPLVAPMPGLIVRISVQAGDRVEAGQSLVVMEAMKMENELRATSGGTVVSIRVQSGAAVEKGAVLIELE